MIKESSSQNVGDRNEPSSSGMSRAQMYKNEGNSSVKDGRYQHALALYTKAIKEDKTDPVFYSNRAHCHLKLHRFANLMGNLILCRILPNFYSFNEAIEDCNQAIHLNSKLAKAYFRRMEAYEQLNKDQMALDDCKQWLTLTPTDENAKIRFEQIQNRIVQKQKGKIYN